MIRLAFSAPVKDDAERHRLLANLERCGYAGVQLKPGDYRDYLAEPRRFFDRFPEAHGKLSACIAYGALDEAGTARLRESLAFAAATGADRVVFCHGIAREGLGQGDLAAIARQLEELGKEARQMGTRLSLHHHFNQPCMHRPDFDVFFGQGNEAYGLTIDTAHLVKSGVADIAEVVRTFRRAIDNFHMKDFADGQFKVLGEGAINFAPVFQSIRDIGYRGWVSADEESGGDLLGGMRKCAAYLKAGLG